MNRELTPTRYSGLRYTKTGNVWRIFDCHEPVRSMPVGEHYRTRAELLADLDRYAREVWAY